jgi:TRAP-type C4-dicarboxylate transport system substrate-binding protein
MRCPLLPLLLAAAAGSTACSRPADQGVIELVYATPYSPAHPFSLADQRWMAYVEERSGGTLRIRSVWSGALLSTEHSMLELRHGVVDIGLITPIYVKGGAHLVRIQSGFYAGIRDIRQQVALYRCMAAHEPQFARELQGLQVLAVQGGSLPGIITRDKPIHTLADLRGLRIRVPTELLPVMRALGADPINVPMGEVYPALAKGVIDGVIAPTDTFKALHLAEVARYYASLRIPRGAYPARAMGEKRWRLLSEAHRAVLRESVAVWEAALTEENERALDEGWQLAQQHGVTRTVIGEDDQRRFDALYLQEARRNAASLQRYGIDGERSWRVARASIRPGGDVDCREDY